MSNTWMNKRNESSMLADWNGTISCGYFDSHDYGCKNESADSQAVEINAMLWAVYIARVVLWWYIYRSRMLSEDTAFDSNEHVSIPMVTCAIHRHASHDLLAPTYRWHLSWVSYTQLTHSVTLLKDTRREVGSACDADHELCHHTDDVTHY
jgi:hypothetical protein